MTEVVEVYADEKIVVREDAKALARAEAAVTAAKEIGMTGLALQDMNRLKARKALAWCEAQGLVELSADDRRTWCMFMPTGYYSDSRMAPAEEWLRSHNLANYQYADGVPMHVRALMKTLQPIMSTLEIRTVETTPVISDPALFGHIVLPNGERKIYLLARWGESDQNFVRDIEDVKKVLKARMGIVYHVERRFPRQLSSEGGPIGSAFALVALGMLLAVLTNSISSALGYRLESPALPFMMMLLPGAATVLAIGTNRALRRARRAHLAKLV
jgi:hypothetical protein